MSNSVKEFDYKVKDVIYGDGHSKFRFDDYNQYVPFGSVYALNLLGVEGKHNFKDRTVILGTATLIMASTVLATKSITSIKRPDNSTSNSFPSGHTATAFMGAEFLYQEYKDKSVWYGVGGYALATITGVLRMYNNRHWFSDVVAGAGVGILSTKIAYLIHPFVNKLLFGEKQTDKEGIVMPFYNGEEYGIGVSVVF